MGADGLGLGLAYPDARRVDPQAWLFLAVITVFNLVIDFMMMIGSAAWSDVSLSFIVNAIILIYVMLRGTKRAFGTAK